MAYIFGDGFDLYAAPADAANGYWDSVGGSPTLGPGRFTGSQAMQFTANTQNLFKTSGVNDALHHLVIAFRQTAAISGSSLGLGFQFQDSSTTQFGIWFRTDGAIVLTSGAAGGTQIATYTGAFPVTNTWYAFEIEVLVSNTAGYMNVRKNGNTSNDFSSATNLNTRAGTANNYANKLVIAQSVGVNGQQIDDLFWRSDAAAVAWMGDIRCYTRMPASDASVQFAKSPISQTQVAATQSTTAGIFAGTAKYTGFTSAWDGTIGSLTLSLGAGYSGNMKCSIFASSGSAPTSVLGSATTITNPVTGVNTFVFGTPVAVSKGTQYWVGWDSDTSSGSWGAAGGTTGFSSTTSYASFPVASPTVVAIAAAACVLTITLTTNYQLTSEAQQDGTATYVYDSTPGHADFYNIAAIASTPVATIAVTTRGYMEKSDAGTRTAAVQLKSGATTVATPTLVLATSGWLWAWRTDTVDPNTSAAWTAAGVNNAQIGPTTVA